MIKKSSSAILFLVLLITPSGCGPEPMPLLAPVAGLSRADLWPGQVLVEILPEEDEWTLDDKCFIIAKVTNHRSTPITIESFQLRIHADYMPARTRYGDPPVIHTSVSESEENKHINDTLKSQSCEFYVLGFSLNGGCSYIGSRIKPQKFVAMCLIDYKAGTSTTCDGSKYISIMVKVDNGT